MGRVKSARRAMSAAAIAGALTLMLAGCDNALMTYLLKGILYRGWQVASWSTPAPVVAGETHEAIPANPNRFPMNMAIGDNGKLHFIGWRENDSAWVYTSMALGAPEFAQSFTVVKSGLPEPDEFVRSPGIDFYLGDSPLIAYGVGYTNPVHTLYYQEYISGWQPADPIVSNNLSKKYAPVYVSYFTPESKSHIWYLFDGAIWHTTASSPSPASWVPSVGTFASMRLGTDDAEFAYTDPTNSQLSYRTWKGTVSTPIWTSPSGIEIANITMARDSSGALCIGLVTWDYQNQGDTSLHALHFVTNAGGTWHELASITGSASSGFMPYCPCSLVIAPDRYGNDHIHLAYTMSILGTYSVWYSYYEETAWHPPQKLDALHPSLAPQIAVDPAGTVHVVYTWWAAEHLTTLMYVRGTPREPQNQ